ncbi:MAG TPA: 2-oxoglutarate dehydrogenase complex dihydrolipoyllysine-residue succinyltransferase [Thioploca sp.]|nr:2-oxoglutarate dehydrogenase complex dihydrolipoyllysine-residue succinyltransferase [Thioploca sp.]
MSIEEVKVPTLAESVADATLLNWQKQPGEAMREGEKLVDIETDKIILEVVAPQAGTLTKIIKADGENVLSAEVIALLDTSAVPTVVSKLVSPSMVEPDAELTLPVLTPTAPPEAAPAKTGPAVRKIAAEQGIDPSAVPHKGSRITKADILQQRPDVQESKSSEIQNSRCVGIQESETAKSPSTPQTRWGATDSPLSKREEREALPKRPEERVPMTRLRKRVAERLLNAQHEHAILTTFNEINMKAVMDLRNQYKEAFEKQHGVKLGFMSFFTKAAVAALQKFPIVNATTEGDDIIYHGYYDIGLAVSSPRGLVVPILRDVDAMSFAEVEKGIADFARRARDAQLSLEDLTGGTFSITNGGIFGSMLSTPILNPPQSAILGMHNIVERPVAEKGQVVIRPVMYVALSYDHRLVDGREAVQFLVAIKNAIEDPTRLLLDI